jgi:hypothetical protein
MTSKERRESSKTGIQIWARSYEKGDSKFENWFACLVFIVLPSRDMRRGPGNQ